MIEQDLKKCALTRFLTIIDEDNEIADLYLREENSARFAEVTDTVRLHDLLHRDEYRPVAAIRCHNDSEIFVRVYFQQLHETQFDDTTSAPQRLSNRPRQSLNATGF